MTILKYIGRCAGAFVITLLFLGILSLPVLAAVPTVTTQNADVDGTTVTLNGNITNTGVVGTDDMRGFVWGLTTNADPGNVAPVASGYGFNWTETGAFGTGAFDYAVTGLTPETMYFYRACAHSVDGWAYGDEICFMALPDGLVYIELSPELDEAHISGKGKPTEVDVGVFESFSLPIWNAGGNVNEELYLQTHITELWDGETNIIAHIYVALANAGESGNSFRLQYSWESATPNINTLPVTTHDLIIDRTIYSNAQYQYYRCYAIIDYDIHPNDLVVADDILGIRLRRQAVAVGSDLNGELLVLHFGLLFARGDLLGDPDVTSTNILMEDDMVLFALIFLPLALMGLAILGKLRAVMFAAVGAWFIIGVYSYTLSTATWDIYYTLFWLCMGLGLVSAFLSMITLGGEKEEKPKEGDVEEDSLDRVIKRQEKHAEKLERLDRAMESSGSRVRRKRQESQSNERLD